MERKLFTGLTALLFFAALVGCVGPEAENDTTNVDIPDDSNDPENDVTVNVTVHAAIDGVVVDPVIGVSLHEADGQTGEEVLLATGTATGVQIPLDVPESGQTVRVWLGPSSASLSSDGHRILEYDGRQWVHPIADVPLEEGGCEESGTNVVDTEGCQPTVNENGYFPYDLYHCDTDAYEYDNADPEFKGAYIYSEEADRWLEVTNGQDIIDDEDAGLNGFLDSGCTLQSFGSTFAVDCPDDAQWTIDSSWNGNGFTISTSHSDTFVSELTCTVQ